MSSAEEASYTPEQSSKRSPRTLRKLGAVLLAGALMVGAGATSVEGGLAIARTKANTISTGIAFGSDSQAPKGAGLQDGDRSNPYIDHNTNELHDDKERIEQEHDDVANDQVQRDREPATSDGGSLAQTPQILSTAIPSPEHLTLVQ